MIKDPFKDIRRLPRPWLDTKDANTLTLRVALVVYLGVVPLLVAQTLARVLLAQRQPYVGRPDLGPFYAPWDLVPWVEHLHGLAAQYPGAVEAIAVGQIAVAVPALIAVTILVLLLHRWMVAKANPAPDTHGSARTATIEEIRAAGLFDNDGPILGFMRVPYTLSEMVATAVRHRSLRPFLVPYAERLIRAKAEWHTLLVAPNGSGKTQDHILQTALTWRGSLIAYALKEELPLGCVGFRASAEGMNSRILLVALGDPEDPRIVPSGYINPLDAIDTTNANREYQDASELVAALKGQAVGDKPGMGSPSESFFTSLSTTFLECLFLWMRYVMPAERCNPAGALQLISDPNADSSRSLLLKMRDFSHAPEKRWRDRQGRATDRNPIIVEAAHLMLTQLTDDQRTSVLSVAATYLAPFRNPVIAQATSRTNFDPRDLLDAEKNLTLVLYAPYSAKNTIQPIVRFLFQALLRRMVRGTVSSRTAKGRCLVQIDELDSLGYVPVIANDINELRGMGVTFDLAVQGYNQIYRRYGKDEPITMACTARVIYRPVDDDTKDKVSHAYGKATLRVKAPPGSGGKGKDGGVPPYIDLPRGLDPNEVGLLPSNRCLIFIGTDAHKGTGLRPIYAWRRHAFEDPEFSYRMGFPPPGLSPNTPMGPGNGDAGTGNRAA